MSSKTIKETPSKNAAQIKLYTNEMLESRTTILAKLNDYLNLMKNRQDQVGFF